MLPLIQQNAARLKALQAKVHRTYRSRSQSQRDYEAWEEACQRFHAEYDSLAFPGGLTRGLELIRQSDHPTIEMALCYLEDPPYCYRSQYVATDLRRAINKATLQEPLASRYANWKKKKAIKKRSKIDQLYGAECNYTQGSKDN